MAPLTAGGARLGTTAKSSTLVETLSEGKAHRALKYQGLSQGRRWLVKAAKKAEPSKFPGDVYRTCDCRWVNHGEAGIAVTPKFAAAHYVGLATCGSVWACPICGARIQERRRPEIQAAIDWANREALAVVMVTFTFPHRSWQSLDDLVMMQRDAFRRMRSSGQWTKLCKRMGYKGLIRALEITHGVNGWHPHTHELWFLEDVPEGFRELLSKRWLKSCADAGLIDLSDQKQVDAFMKHAVDVRQDVTCGEYLAKLDDSRRWGFAEEMSKATSKAGRAKGVHPHHFLARRAEGDEALYVEYVTVTKNRRCRQLYWSPGLKNTVGINDLTDEELAEESQEAAEILGMFSSDDLKVIKGNDALAEALDAAEEGFARGGMGEGWRAVQMFLQALRI